MKTRTLFNCLIVILGVVAITSFCFAPAFAEEDTANSEPQDDFAFDEPGEDLEILDDAFGDNYQYTWIPIYSFAPAASDVGYEYANNYGYAYFTSTAGGDPYLMSTIRLPSGAYLSSLRFYYRDSHTGYARIEVFRNNGGQPNGTLLRIYNSTGTPGYSSTNLAIGETIRNGDKNYSVFMRTSSATSLLQVYGVRLFWRRQLRTGLFHPFTDLGGYGPFFVNSIAALYQSGITSGTSATTFGPNQPLTRAQMAGFLATALGLHWSYPY